MFNVDVSETDASRRMAEVLGNDKHRKGLEEGESSVSTCFKWIRLVVILGVSVAAIHQKREWILII